MSWAIATSSRAKPLPQDFPSKHLLTFLKCFSVQDVYLKSTNLHLIFILHVKGSNAISHWASLNQNPNTHVWMFVEVKMTSNSMESKLCLQFLFKSKFALKYFTQFCALIKSIWSNINLKWRTAHTLTWLSIPFLGKVNGDSLALHFKLIQR